jgi:colicin import membrane protein
MNAHAEIQDIAAIVETNPVAVLVDDNLYARFYEHCRAEVEAFEPDLSTATSRKEIASLAYKVTRTKTAIDNAGKKLNEDARAKINAVDAKRRVVRDEFEALAEQARKPLTDWETQEEARVEYCMSILKAIEDCGKGLISGEHQPFGILLHELENKIVINSELGEFEEQARVAHKIALDKVRSAFEAHQKAEADRIELEKLRAEKAERDRLDAERIEKEREKAEAAERERIETERREREAAEQKTREERAAQLAREQAEREAKEAIERAEREKTEAIAKAEAEARAVREKAEREERERQDAIRRDQEAQAARERDREHRGRIMGEAKAALMAQGAGEATAKKIVLAIIAGEIPNVRMEF